MFKVGEEVRVLIEYNLCKAVVKRINPKSLTVELPAQHGWCAQTKRMKPEKIAGLNESIAIVWENWKGVNGRGAHRIERELYPEYRKYSKEWPHQQYLPEKSYGKLFPQYEGLD